MKSLGLRKNPNIMTFKPNIWSHEPYKCLYNNKDNGGIWVANNLSSAKKLVKYMKEKYNINCFIFKTYIGKILFTNSYRTKTDKVLLFEKLIINNVIKYKKESDKMKKINFLNSHHYYKGDRIIIFRKTPNYITPLEYRNLYNIGATAIVVKSSYCNTENIFKDTIKVIFESGPYVDNDICKKEVIVYVGDILLIPIQHNFYIGDEVIFKKHIRSSKIKRGTIGKIHSINERGVYVKIDSDQGYDFNGQNITFASLDSIRQKYYNLPIIRVKERHDGWFIIKSNKTRPTKIGMSKKRAIAYARLIALENDNNYIYVYDIDDGKQCRVLYPNGNSVEIVSTILTSKHMLTSKVPK